MEKGEIWLIDLPGSNGQEQTGQRPAVLIADSRIGIVTVVPLTSNLQALRFPASYLIPFSKINGLSADSVALVFQLRAIDSKRLKKRIGNLESKHVSKLNDLLLKYLGI